MRRLMDAPTLTMEDFMGLTTLEEQADRSLVGMPKAFSDFTEMFAVDYNLLKKELSRESGKEVTLEEYLLGIRDAGKFDHKMNKPVQEFLSVVLDATIIKPLIESVTGEDMITGEDLSEFEKGMKLASGVVSLFTLGQGGVIINGGRVAFQSTLVTMGKMVAIDMVTTGVTYGTSELCQKMGMPGSVTMLLSMLAGGKVGNVLNNKWLANLSAEDAARVWKNLEPGEKLPPGMTGDEYAKYLKGLGHVDDASALGKVDYEEVLRVRKEGASRAKSNNFKGTLKGKEIELPNVSTKQVTYTKRNPVECTKLRNNFNSNVRSDFLKDFAGKSSNKLKEFGFSDVDIAKLKDGLVPKGYQVHHKLPLDDGGTNDFSNLVLIKNDPYHKVITNYQNSVTKGLEAGESIKVEWPIPEGSYYNGR